MTNLSLLLLVAFTLPCGCARLVGVEDVTLGNGGASSVGAGGTAAGGTAAGGTAAGGTAAGGTAAGGASTGGGAACPPPACDECEPQQLAQGSGTVWYLAVDADYVYWPNSDDNHIRRVPTTGGAVDDLVQNAAYPIDVAVDAAWIYWTSLNGHLVAKAPKAGGSATTMVIVGTAYPSALVYDGVDFFWTDHNSPGTVHKIQNGTDDVVIATGQGWPNGIAVDDNDVYWTNDEQGNASVMRAPKAGGNPTTLASGQSNAGAIAVDAMYVYWENFMGGGLRRVAKDGAQAQYDELVPTSFGQLRGLALDGDWIYFGAWDTQSLGRVRTDGTCRQNLVGGLAAGGIEGLALDATSIYFASGGSIWRVPK